MWRDHGDGGRYFHDHHFLFFGDFKASLIVGSSIPTSILMSLISYDAGGFTLNIITMSGLVLGVGMMVDNSIVVFRRAAFEPWISSRIRARLVTRRRPWRNQHCGGFHLWFHGNHLVLYLSHGILKRYEWPDVRGHGLHHRVLYVCLPAFRDCHLCRCAI